MKKNKSFAHSTPKPSKKRTLGVAAPKKVPTKKDPSTLKAGLERLERAIAHMGLASRREAKALITGGKVKVNGKVIKESGFGIVFDKDNIEVEGAALQGKETVLVYKPRGLETNKTTDGAEDLHDYFPKLKHLAPIGRLDKDSEGLIIMSNDGSLARALTQENSPIGKTYEVEVRENVTDDALNKMRTGIMLDKVKTKPAEVQRLSRKMFSIVLHEGRKHQIRRMCDACHLNVESLIRTDIGHLSIGTMKPGSMRKMILDDVEKLKSL
jgi:23S rRNA pseudouridine2605 synthase